MKRMLLVQVLFGAATVASADTFTWYNWVKSGSVTNPANWRVGSATPDRCPGWGDDAQFSSFSYADSTMVLPTVDFWAKSLVSWWGNGGERMLTFKGVDEDGLPSVFRLAASSERQRTAGNVLSLSTGGNSYYLQHAVGAGAGAEDAFVWSNALVRVKKIDKLNVWMDFLEGSYDFSDSSGSNTTYFASSGNGDQHDFCRIAFENVEAKFSTFYNKCRAKTNLLVFNGGRYSARTNFKIVGDSYSPEGRTVVKIVSNAVVSASGLLTMGDCSNHPIVLTIADGGRLESTGVHSGNNCSRLTGRHADSEIVVGADGLYSLSSADATWLETRLVVTGRNAKVTASLPDGQKGEFSLGVGAKASIRVADGGTLGDPNSMLKITLGHSYGPNILELADGGTIYCNNGLQTGCDYNATPNTNLVSVTGGTGVFSAITLRPDYQGSNTGEGHNIYRQTGGTVTVNGDFTCVAKSNADASKKYGHVILDGGTLTCGKLYSSASQKAGKTGHADFVSNGGTLAANKTTTSFFYNFDSATLGEKGLTLALGGNSVTLGQKLVNADGADGKLVKTGSGTLTLNAEAASSTFSRFEQREGTVAFASGVTAFDPVVSVSPDAILDVSNLGTALALGGLELGDAEAAGVLKCKTTQTLALSSAKVVKAALMLTDAHGAGTYPLFRAPTATVDDDTVNAWMTSSVLSGRQDGLCYNFTAVPDGDDTVFNLVVATGSEPANVITWKSAGENTRWTDPSNWEGVRQGAADVATFAGGASVEAPVTVDQDVIVGRLAFTGGGTDYALTGVGKLTFADTGYAAVSVNGGTQTVSAETVLNGCLSASVAGGAKLVFDGAIWGGGITKTGTGALELGAENAFTSGFEAKEGLFVAKSPKALASVSPVRQVAKVGDGTLRIEGDPEGADTRLDYDLVLEASAPVKATVVDNDANITFGALSSSAGAFVKKGRGRLTFEAGAGATTICSSSKITAAGAAGEVNFSPDGTPPEANYGGLTVAEGELVLRGTLPETKVSESSQCFKVPGSLKLGTATTNELSASPKLTVDHAYIRLLSGLNYIAPYMAANPGTADMQKIGLVLTNGAYASIDTYLQVGYTDGKGDGLPAEIELGVYDSTLSCTWNTMMPGRKNASVIFRSVNSAVSFVHDMSFNGPFDGVLSGGSISSYRDARKLAYLSVNGDANGQFLFADKAVVHAKALQCSGNAKTGNRFLFVFDDAELDLTRADAEHLEIPGDYNTSTDISATMLCPRGDQFDIVARGEMRLYAGLSRTAKEEQTLTWYQPVIGEGGIVKLGKGILDLKPAAVDNGSGVLTPLADHVTLKTTGENRIEAGTMKVSGGSADGALIKVLDGAALVLDGDNAVRVAGPGPVRGGTIRCGTISVRYDPSSKTIVGDIPTIESALSGGNFVDLNLPTGFVFDGDLPKNLVVATYAGSAPIDFSRWHIVDQRDLKVSGDFRLVDGKIVLDVCPPRGLTLMVR